ncbi:MAG: hypothetical protein CR988_01510 [Treponema sp.]|nr:MAG: hypothetical protein CR988_01510 [Treponema sp.]
MFFYFYKTLRLIERLKKAGMMFLGLLLMSVSIFGEEFRFKFSEGDTYRINSLVKENVYVNMKFSHNALITNRITVEISDVKEDSALFNCSFMTSEKNTNRAFSWAKSYLSVFRRNSLGVYTISDEYYMPVVRDVPIFPLRDVKVGETWKAEGHEAHDLTDLFGFKKPFIVPFEVEYTYEGLTEKDGKKLHLITAKYNLMHSPPVEAIMKARNNPKIYPVKTLGFSVQKLYWDNEAGNLPYYTEEFVIRLILNTGDIMDFTGNAEAQIIEFKQLDKVETAADIKKDIENLGVEDTEVKETEEGVTISLENIQFESESSVLLRSEKAKLKKIGEILKKYPERDFLVSGHTALAGTEQGRQELSEERAKTVAEYLIKLGVKEAHRIFTQGFGATRPIAPNDTEENMSRNRRVEITILAD